jgi:hypothetical protein
MDTVPLADRLIQAIDRIIALVDEMAWQDHPVHGQLQVATSEQIKAFDELDDLLRFLVIRLGLQVPTADGQWALVRQRGCSQLPVRHEWLDSMELMDSADWRNRMHRLRSVAKRRAKSDREKPGPKEGVSLRDAAMIMADEDHQLAGELKGRWRKTQAYKSLQPIGTCPRHKQVKLFRLSAISDFVEETEGVEACRQNELRRRLRRKVRKPR